MMSLKNRQRKIHQRLLFQRVRLYDSEPLKVQLDLLKKLNAGIAMERMHRDLDGQ